MYYVSATTDVGIHRSINQDSVLVQRMSTQMGEMVFACVCDGMGGLQDGELASATVIMNFKKWVYEKLPLLTLSGKISEEDIRTQWSEVVSDSNEKICVYGQKKGLKCGTTLTAGLFTENKYYIANIGDSRAYEIGKSIRQITHDHTFIQQEIDAGRMTPEEAAVSKKGHLLARCIGVEESTSTDFFFGKVERDAVYLFCSDGFRHKISEEEMLALVNAEKISSSVNLKKIETTLIQLNKERQEKDNISVATVIKK